MKTIYIFFFLWASILLAGCDYNDKYFDGYDDDALTDIINYEGAYTGAYPAEGYFTDRASVEESVNDMLKGMFLYPDKGSTAKITISFGDVTPGYQAADINYELADADYESMGTEMGQPGKFKNFDANMPVDDYLTAFCETKYASQETGKIVTITYKFYKTGEGTSNQTASYQKEASGWVSVELNAYSTDYSYTLVLEDYREMGRRYDDFGSGVDIDHNLTNFLRLKYPYAPVGATAKITYNYFVSVGNTQVQSRIYKNEGLAWTYYDPYASTTEVSDKIAEMEFDGTAWKLLRLMGGKQELTLTQTEYALLVAWVKTNKPEYMKSGSNEEFYFGSADMPNYQNINNSYSNWKSNIPAEYGSLTNDELQKLMDERIAWGITHILLPEMLDQPSVELTYVVVYNVYGGRGSGNYAMSFVYNQETDTFELTSGPAKQ